MKLLYYFDETAKQTNRSFIIGYRELLQAR